MGDLVQGRAVHPSSRAAPRGPEHGHGHRRADPGRAILDLVRGGPAIGQREPFHALRADLTSRPGTAAISARSGRRVPEVQSGWARIASATRRSGVPAGAVTSTRSARASPVRDSPEQRGAAAVHRHHQDLLTGQFLQGAPDRDLHRVSRVEVAGRPASRPTHSRPAWRRASRSSSSAPGPGRHRGAPARAGRGSSIGSAGGQRSAPSVSPARARISRTPARWKSSPEWLAAASASSLPSRSSEPGAGRPPAAAC